MYFLKTASQRRSRSRFLLSEGAWTPKCSKLLKRGDFSWEINCVKNLQCLCCGCYIALFIWQSIWLYTYSVFYCNKAWVHHSKDMLSFFQDAQKIYIVLVIYTFVVLNIILSIMPYYHELVIFKILYWGCNRIVVLTLKILPQTK